MPKMISDAMFEQLQKLAADKLSDEEYFEAYEDTTMWGNVDDSMNWADTQARNSFAAEILEDINKNN